MSNWPSVRDAVRQPCTQDSSTALDKSKQRNSQKYYDNLIIGNNCSFVISLMVAIALEKDSQAAHLLPCRPMCPHVLLNPCCSPGPALLRSLPMKEVLFMGLKKLCTRHMFSQVLSDLFPIFWPYPRKIRFTAHVYPTYFRPGQISDVRQKSVL